MYSPLRSLRFAIIPALALSGFVFTGCGVSVNSFVERGANLTRYRTFDWAPADAFTTGDPRLDNNSMFAERLQTDVEKGLAAMNFEKTERPDLLLHYHASVSQKIDVNGVDRERGYCSDECSPYVYDAGTLTLDFVDAHTNKLVWRGWADGSIDGAIDNQVAMEQRVDDAVSRILARFPH